MRSAVILIFCFSLCYLSTDNISRELALVGVLLVGLHGGTACWELWRCDISHSSRGNVLLCGIAFCISVRSSAKRRCM
jgi:hypothetical protein